MKMFSLNIQTPTAVLKINLYTAYQYLLIFFVEVKLKKLDYVKGSTCLNSFFPCSYSIDSIVWIIYLKFSEG